MSWSVKLWIEQHPNPLARPRTLIEVKVGAPDEAPVESVERLTREAGHVAMDIASAVGIRIPESPS